MTVRGEAERVYLCVAGARSMTADEVRHKRGGAGTVRDTSATRPVLATGARLPVIAEARPMRQMRFTAFSSSAD